MGRRRRLFGRGILAAGSCGATVLQVGDRVSVAGTSRDGEWLALNDHLHANFPETVMWIFYDPGWVDLLGTDFETLPLVAVALPPPTEGLASPDGSTLAVLVHDFTNPNWWAASDLLVFVQVSTGEQFTAATFPCSSH